MNYIYRSLSQLQNFTLNTVTGVKLLGKHTP